MANTLTPIMGKILARGLLALRPLIVMPRVVNSNWGAETAQKGQTIDVPIPASMTATDVTPSNTPLSPDSVAPTTVPIPLTNWKQAAFHLTDKERGEIDESSTFLPMQASEAIKAIATAVNASLFGTYTSVFNVAGTPGTTPFASNDAEWRTARKFLNTEGAGLMDRRVVIDFDAGASVLGLAPYRDASQSGDQLPVIEGIIGRKVGADWYESSGVPTHTAGTLVSGSPPTSTAYVNNGAGYAAGVDTINIDGNGAAMTGTLVVGDIISFSGHSQTYAVIANTGSAQFSGSTYTAAANAIASLKVYPALRAAVVDNEVITVKGSHVVNLGFHRDAFAFANRPLAGTDGLGSLLQTMQDPETGINLRLEISRQNRQEVWSFDILYGCALVRPELAVRIFG